MDVGAPVTDHVIKAVSADTLAVGAETKDANGEVCPSAFVQVRVTGLEAGRYPGALAVTTELKDPADTGSPTTSPSETRRPVGAPVRDNAADPMEVKEELTVFGVDDKNWVKAAGASARTCASERAC